MTEPHSPLQLYVSVFIASLGLGMYIYFIPVFAQTFNATFLDLGLIGSANALTYAVTPMLVGYLADRFNRAWLYTLGLAINILSTITLVLSGSVRDIILVRLLGGFAYGFFWPTAEILVTDLAAADKRVREVGRYSVAWASGILIGPSVGGLIVQDFGFIQLFIIAAVVITLSIVPAVLGVVPRYHQKTTTLPDFSKSLSTIRGLLAWYMMTLCYGVVFSIIAAIFPGYANTVGVDLELIGVLFTVFGISRVLVFATAEKYLRLGEKKVLSLSSATIALAALAIAIFPNFNAFLISLLFIGGAFGVIFPITLGLISRHFPDERLGVAVGSYETIFGIGFTVGPILAGTAASLVSAAIAFELTAAFGAMMAFFALAGRTRPPKHTCG